MADTKLIDHVVRGSTMGATLVVLGGGVMIVCAGGGDGGGLERCGAAHAEKAPVCSSVFCKGVGSAGSPRLRVRNRRPPL